MAIIQRSVRQLESRLRVLVLSKLIRRQIARSSRLVDHRLHLGGRTVTRVLQNVQAGVGVVREHTSHRQIVPKLGLDANE